MLTRITAGPGKLPPILEVLIRQLRQGRPAAGARFPTKQDLAQRFDISPLTAQRLITQLQEWGFLVTTARRQTRVVYFPAHRHRFGLALYDDLAAQETHCRALALAAAAQPKTWELFHGAASVPALQEALRIGRLAGVVMPSRGEFSALDFARIRVPMVGPGSPVSRPDRVELMLQESAFIFSAAQE